MVMVDSVEHLDLIEEVATSFVAPIRVAIDIDLSWWPLGGLLKLGVKRSPIRTAEQAVDLAREIERRNRFKLVGALAYEGQIAGVGDNVPRKAITNLIVRSMQSASAKDVIERRAEIVTALSELAPLEFVNGGGTGPDASLRWPSEDHLQRSTHPRSCAPTHAPATPGIPGLSANR